MAAVRFVLECRSTRKGAFTTMEGTPFDESGSGKHWKEWMEVGVGDKISIKDISNSDKHSCRIIEITAVEPVVEWKVLEEADSGSGFCPVCGK